MSGGGGGSTTSKSIAEPSKEVKPYLRPYMERASGLSYSPYEDYRGSTVAGLNRDQNTAFGAIRNRALRGSEVGRGANRNAADTLSGRYLDPESNPWLKSTYDAAASDMARNYTDAVIPGINSTFSRAGRYGSNAQQAAIGDAGRTLASNLSNMGTNIYGQNYQQERGNQLNAMGMSSQLAASDYNDANALMGAGDAQRAFSQEGLADAYSRWQQAKQFPYKNLDVLGNAIMTTMGAGGSTKVYNSGGAGANRNAQIAGGGMALAGLLA